MRDRRFLRIDVFFYLCSRLPLLPQDFAVLASQLPVLLNSSTKRALLPAIRALIPPEYVEQYDVVLGHMGLVRGWLWPQGVLCLILFSRQSKWTTLNKETAQIIRKQRVEHEVHQQEQTRQQLASLQVRAEYLNSFRCSLIRSPFIAGKRRRDERPREHV